MLNNRAIDRSFCSPLFALLVVSFASGCAHYRSADSQALIGSWRGDVQFSDGAFAETKDLAFLYVFNAGGTMTESSNYDGAPPVPPAYGIWRKVGDRVYEAKYEYFWTKAPATSEVLLKSGWEPGGRGVLFQRITLSEDRRSFDSTIKYEVFDKAGKPTEKESHANAHAVRLEF
jgi:hypothetical protein